ADMPTLAGFPALNASPALLSFAHALASCVFWNPAKHHACNALARCLRRASRSEMEVRSSSLSAQDCFPRLNLVAKGSNAKLRSNPGISGTKPTSPECFKSGEGEGMGKGQGMGMDFPLPVQVTRLRPST